MSVGTPYWHISPYILAERLTTPIEEWIAVIRENRPTKEVETHLRLMRPIRDVSAFEALEVARVRAREAYSVAVHQAWEVLEVLHLTECPNCPWNGMTIFSGGEET